MAQPAAADRRVTACIPYFGCKPYIAQAVESILSQTHRDLQLVVVNDADPDPPWDVLSHLDDPRLVRFDLAENRGRYFADAVVLGATTAPYYLIQDADNWSAPRRVNRLLRALEVEKADVAVSGYYSYGSREAVARGVDDTASGHFLVRPASPTQHKALFCRYALERIGGYYGGFRIHFDTLLMTLVAVTCRLALVQEPLYHKRVRPASLSTSKATGLGSSYRVDIEEYVRRQSEVARAAHARHQAGEISHQEVVAIARDLGQERVTAKDRQALASEVRRLAAVLSGDEPEAG